MLNPPQNPRQFESILQVVEDLLGPDGCPWDKEQTPKTLMPYVIEEAHELVEAIEQEESLAYIEELGDLLLQVLLHSKMAEKRGEFTFEDVVETLTLKLVRRHPHVFGDVQVSGTGEVLKNWEQIKKSEKEKSGKKHDPLGIPHTLPALQRAQKLGEKAKKEAFDWSTWQEVFKKVEEEVGELKAELNQLKSAGDHKESIMSKVQDELGDMFFVLAQLTRKLKLEAETVARQGNRKFETRFRALLKLCEEKEIHLKDLPDAEKEKLWQEIKKQQQISS